MTYRVMKFGGSSVGSPERIKQVVELIAAERARGPAAVVVSAMGDTTDWLLEAADHAARGEVEAAERVVDRIADLATTSGLVAHQGSKRLEITPIVREITSPLRQLLHAIGLLRECSPQTRDLVMSFGERLSSAVLTELLEGRGVPAVRVDARTWLVTDARFGDAFVDFEASRAKVLALAAGWGERVPIHTGFIGATPDGRTTTLGRNGSDYTATLLARALGAAEVMIWTDVSGVMTADPGIVADSYPIARLTYTEALELASYGARMFHPRTMIPLIESGIPLSIRNTMEPSRPGTRVDAAGAHDEKRPTSVTSLEKLALIGVRWRQLAAQAQMGHRVLSALERAKVVVWMATQAAHGQAVAVVVPARQVDEAVSAVQRELALELERHDAEAPQVRAPITLLSLVAETMGQESSAAGRFFHALAQVGVPIRAIGQGASSRSISCAIDAADTEVAVRTVHAAFNFAHQGVSLLVLGKGTVGSHLLEQIASEARKLAEDHEVALRVVGISASDRTLFDERGVDLSTWRERLAASPRRSIVELLDLIKHLPVPILVDCTAADGMEGVYREAFARGINVVAANKKPLTIPWSERERLMGAAKAHHRAYLYETTVGASLPVIGTLENLVRTGDRVHLVEGSFSGTLGYLTNELMRGVALSHAVRTAREKGYTEPEPQDDLSGLDVARKALILARELGLSIELEQVAIEPFVPAELLAERDLDAFFAALERRDAAFAERIERARREKRVLRYLARIEPHGSVRVGPIEIPDDHPAARLRGAEAFFAFSTERYSEYPLIVEGAGAGGAVTAAGVLADILKIAQTLRGR